MPYKEWVVIHIVSFLTSNNINIKNANISWGKFYLNGDQNKEISPVDINKIFIPPGTSKDVGSRCDSNSTSGTEGTIELYDADVEICKIYWNCPWGVGDNEFQISSLNSGYKVNVGAWNKEGGAMGDVTVEVTKK